MHNNKDNIKEFFQAVKNVLKKFTFQHIKLSEE